MALLCSLAALVAACSPDVSVEVDLGAAATTEATADPRPAGSVEEFCRVIAEFDDSDELDAAFEILLDNQAGDRREARATAFAALERFVDAAPAEMRGDAQFIRRLFLDAAAIVEPYAGEDQLPDFVDEQLTLLIAGPEAVAVGERLDAFEEEVCRRE